jgi:hypothetical protein
MYFKTDVVKHKVSFSYFYLLFYVRIFLPNSNHHFCDSFTEKLLASNFFHMFFKIQKLYFTGPILTKSTNQDRIGFIDIHEN